MKVMNPGNIDAQPTADADHHLWEVYVRSKLPIVHLDGGDSGGDSEVSLMSHDGHEAILKEVVGPGLIAVNTCVDMMCVSIIRATTGALPIVGDESHHGRQRHPQE